MSSDVQLELYPRASLDELTAVDEERVTFITGSTKPASTIIDGAGAVAAGARAVHSGDKSVNDELRLGFVDDGCDARFGKGMKSWRLRLKEVYENNQGLLFIMLSQFCASCMNISVKMLNGLDPPVPPFEVRSIYRAGCEMC